MNSLALSAIALFFVVMILAWFPPSTKFLKALRGPEPTPLGFYEGFRTAYCPSTGLPLDPVEARLRQQLPLSDFSADFAARTPDFRLAA